MFGYVGGEVDLFIYEQVCKGDMGYVEVVRFIYYFD